MNSKMSIIRLRKKSKRKEIEKISVEPELYSNKIASEHKSSTAPYLRLEFRHNTLLGQNYDTLDFVERV